MLTVDRHGDQAGFTLIELIVAMSVGMIVLFALFTLVDRSLPATKRITDRVEAEQRARPVIEHFEQALHSAVCLSNGTDSNGNAVYLTPISSLSPTQVTWYDDVPNPNNGDVTNASFAPEQRQLAYNAATNSLVETKWAITSSSPPYQLGTPSTRTLLTNVRQDGSTPVFAFWGYDPTTGDPTATTDPTKIAKIDVNFAVGPSTGNGTATPQDATYSSSASLGLPTDFTNASSSGAGPVCGI